MSNNNEYWKGYFRGLAWGEYQLKRKEQEERKAKEAEEEARKREQEFERLMEESSRDLEREYIFEKERRKEWSRKLGAEIDQCAQALEKLYAAIRYYPMRDADSFDGQNAAPDAWPYFDLSRESEKWPPGISLLPGPSKSPKEYIINYIIGTAEVSSHYSDDEDRNQRAMVGRARRVLAAIREKFLIPNESNWRQWVRLAMRVQGASESDIELELSEKKIPVNSPSNDVVYRTPEEIAWFDKVAQRIILLTKVMVRSVQDWAYLIRGMSPPGRDVSDRETVSWEAYVNALDAKWEHK